MYLPSWLHQLVFVLDDPRSFSVSRGFFVYDTSKYMYSNTWYNAYVLCFALLRVWFFARSPDVVVVVRFWA